MTRNSTRPLKRQKLSKKSFGPQDILGSEISLLLRNKDIRQFQRFEVIEVDIIRLSANGEGIGFTTDGKDNIVVVPFCLPSERVQARIYRTNIDPPYALGDLVSVLQKSKERNESLIKCKYFGQCSGCQFQHVSYNFQLLHKRKVVQDAYKHLNFDIDIQDVQVSPLEYGYRTKITPHFNNPSKNSNEDIPIGFEVKGRRVILDIEECPIATPTLNSALPNIRKNVLDNIKNYKRGATLLLRESLSTLENVKNEHNELSKEPSSICITDHKDIVHEDNELSKEPSSICITDHKEIVHEKVGNLYKFEFLAGSFFQNNNSILPILAEYVHTEAYREGIKHLVDTYCGAGFFACTSRKHNLKNDNKNQDDTIDTNDRNYESIHAIEVSPQSIEFAKRNAQLNNLPMDKTHFHLGSAEAIFDKLGPNVPGFQTSLIIDPPRKGCDEVFLDQVLKFAPNRIVYVSCNVHTQARDVKYLLNGGNYEIERIKPFDLFPQTYHVESVATLKQKITSEVDVGSTEM